MENRTSHNLINCPHCHEPLVDGYWETIVEDEQGNFTLDAFNAWVCQNRCGYYVKKDSGV